VRISILASGRGSNLQALLREFQSGQYGVQIVGIGSDNADAPALALATGAGFPVKIFAPIQYENSKEQERAILFWLEELDVQLLVLAGYMRLLSSFFVREACPIINIHPSLLPSFPGLNAQRQALEFGVRYSGCTVHFVDEGMDSGPIILQQIVPVYTEDTEASLSARILREEHKLLPEAVRLLTAGRVHREGRRVRIDWQA
jgi:phosphoribosylglycinamide formyltransferase-1